MGLQEGDTTPADKGVVGKIEKPVVITRQNGLTGDLYESVEGEADTLTSDVLKKEGLDNRQPINTGSPATVEAIRTGRPVIVNRKS